MTSAMFSQRTQVEPELNELFEAWRALSDSARAACLDLTISNPTRAGFAYSQVELGSALAAAEFVDYAAAPFGAQVARNVLAECMAEEGAPIAADNLFLTASTSEAYGMLFKLLCDPGDSMLMPTPSYPLLDQLAALDAVQLAPYRCAYDGAWHVDWDSLCAQRTARTRAVVVVSPNNPTGHQLGAADFERLLDLELPLIVDEVFSAYQLDSAAPFLPARTAKRGLVFSLHGLSKYAGLPQLKLAWTCIAGAPEQVAEAKSRLETILDAYLPVSLPVQAALAGILELAKPMRARILARLLRNWQLLELAVAGTALTLLPTQAGWSACLRLPALCTDMQWAQRCLREVRVYAYPGSFYGLGPAPHLVLSLLAEESAFADAVARVVSLVARDCA